MMNTNVSGNIEGVLSRSVMKQIMAGSAGNNIYCYSTRTNQQYECNSSVYLEDCLDGCIGAFGDDCQGCAEFARVSYA